MFDTGDEVWFDVVNAVSLSCQVDEDKVDAEYKGCAVSIEMPRCKASQAEKLIVET